MPGSVEPWLGMAGVEGDTRALLPLDTLASLSAVPLEVAVSGQAAHTSSIYILGGSVKLLCTSECPLQSFAQEVARDRSVTSGQISE